MNEMNEIFFLGLRLGALADWTAAEVLAREAGENLAANWTREAEAEYAVRTAILASCEDSCAGWSYTNSEIFRARLRAEGVPLTGMGNAGYFGHHQDWAVAQEFERRCAQLGIDSERVASLRGYRQELQSRHGALPQHAYRK